MSKTVDGRRQSALVSVLSLELSQSYVALWVILPSWVLPWIAAQGFRDMHSSHSAQLRLRGEMLLQGRIDDLLDAYLFPLPIFLPERRMLLLGPDHTRLVLALLHDQLVRTGIVAVRPELRAVELPRDGRYRLWADWHEIDASGETRSSSAIYYCRTTALGPRIEMVNYTRLSMPELNHEFEALALSA